MDYFVDTIDRYFQAISGCDHFIVKKVPEKNYGVINYLVSNSDTFPTVTNEDTEENLSNILRRNCRGIKFRLSDSKILALPHWKFFNIGEKEETQEDCIVLGNTFHFIEKLDGSMVHPILINDKILWMTKMGENNISEHVSKFIDQHPNKENIEKLARSLLESDYTPCFEFCSPTAKIVVQYDKPELFLTEIRNNFTGKIVPIEQLISISNEYNIPMGKIHQLKFNSIHELVEEVRVWENSEGIIVRTTSDKFKLKTDWYRERHRVVSDLMTEKSALTATIVNDNLDDLLSYLDDGEFKTKVSKFGKDVTEEILKIINHASALILEAKKNDVPSNKFYDYLVTNGIFYHIIMMKIYRRTFEENLQEADIKEILLNNYRNFMTRKISNSVRLEEHRNWIGGLRYSDYTLNLFFNVDFE